MNKKAIKEYFEHVWATWYSVVFSPREFYANMPTEGGKQWPFMFFAIMFLITGILQGIYGLFDFWDFGDFFLTLLMLIPLGLIAIAFELFVYGGLIHKFIMNAPKKMNFEATFRVVAFSKAVVIFKGLPFFGGLPFVRLVLFGWGVWLMFEGLKAVHRLSTKDAVIALLIATVIVGAIGYVLINLGLAFIMG